MWILSEKLFMSKCSAKMPLSSEWKQTDTRNSSYQCFFIISGDYVLYWSFDTLDNVILLEGTKQNNFGSLVFGQVTWHNSISKKLLVKVLPGGLGMSRHEWMLEHKGTSEMFLCFCHLCLHHSTLLSEGDKTASIGPYNLEFWEVTLQATNKTSVINSIIQK